MDTGELVKIAPELRTIVTTIVAGVPIAEIVKAIVVPPAAVLGKRMADRVERLFEKTGKMVQDAGITPQPVSDKLVIEIVQGALLEDNEDLHTMWAALLANAASPENAPKVRPSFSTILRQMAPDEAHLLKWIDGRSAGWSPHVGGLNWHEAEVDLGFRNESEAQSSRHFHPQLLTCLDGLEGCQLIRREYLVPDKSVVLNDARDIRKGFVPFRIMLTERGSAFLNACRPPKPKENG